LHPPVHKAIACPAALCVKSDIASEDPSSTDAATILLDAATLYLETTFETIVGTRTPTLRLMPHP